MTTLSKSPPTSSRDSGLDIDRLDNVKRLPDGSIHAACPACRATGSDKSGNHLQIKPDGRFGCAVHPDDREHRKEIFRLAGSSLRDAGHRSGRDAKIAAVYDYTDEAGKVIYECIRYEPKTFRQRQPDKSVPGGYRWTLEGCRRVLYRLPKLIANKAANNPKPVFLVEGEKDVAALEARGFIATCNVGGAVRSKDAANWQDSYTKTLAGQDVVIISDKDDEGRLHAAIVAGKLEAVCRSVKIIEVSGDGNKDASDFFSKGGTVEQLAALVDATPTKVQQIVERYRQRLYDPANPPPKPATVFFVNQTPVSTADNISTISATIKAGKSAAVGAMIASTFAVPDADCLGFRSRNPDGLAVLHIDTEQPPFDHHALIDRAIKRAGRDTQPAWLFSYCLTGFSQPEIRNAIRPLAADAARQCGGLFAVLIDGIADASTDVNDAAEANSFVAELHALAIEYHCHIVCVIHLNPGSEFKTRGHLGSQLERKAESNLRLEKDETGVITLWADKNRRAPIIKATGPRFVWDDAAAMHVSVESQQDTKEHMESEALGILFSNAFSNRKSMSYTDLKVTVKRTCDGSDSTAERKIRRAVTFGIVKKTFGGLYELKD